MAGQVNDFFYYSVKLSSTSNLCYIIIQSIYSIDSIKLKINWKFETYIKKMVPVEEGITSLVGC